MEEAVLGDQPPDSIATDSQQVTWILVICTFFCYVFQAVPYSFYETVLPTLYGLADMSEDDLTWLRFSSIPWCLKFIAGLLFQCVWAAPRWVVIAMQIVSGCVLLALTWVPLNQVVGQTVIGVIVSLLLVIHDSAFDGQMICLFRSNSGLLQMIQMLAYVLFDVILSFVGVAFYTRWLFFAVGAASAVGSLLLLVYDWPWLPLSSAPQILDALRESAVSAASLLLYFFFTTWGDSMLWWFMADVFEDDEFKTGLALGLYLLFMFLGLGFGHWFYHKIEHRFAVVIALGVETVSVLLYIFLKPESSDAAAFICFCLGGLTTSVSDAEMQMLSIDASALSRQETFTYAWLQSLLNVGASVGGVAFPQAKERMSWTVFWVVNIVICGALCLLPLLLFTVTPLGADKALTSKSTLSLGLSCRIQIDDQQAVDPPAESEQGSAPAPR